MKKLSSTFFNIKSNNLSTSAYKSCACWPKPNYGPTETQRSEMMNGIKIVAAKTSGTPMAACTIMFQAGSRYETHDDLGTSHFLRAASTRSGQYFTAFSKLRVLQQSGAYLTCTSDRQSIAYTLRCPVMQFGELKYYLLDTAVRCLYHDWEVSDIKSQVRGDLARISPEQRVIDLVQKACWAGPLANSTFCEYERIDGMSGENLRNYVKRNFLTNRCTVASVGVPFDETLKLAERINTSREKPPCEEQPPSRPRGGFEYYDLGAGSDTWIAVAVPGCGTDDSNNLYKHAILASACGTENTQEGDHEFNRICQPPLGLISENDNYTSLRAFNISYAENGVFGIIAKTRSSTACKTALAMSKFLANISDLNFKQIAIGKKRLQLSLAQHEEDCVKESEGFALQAFNNVQIDSMHNLIELIDKIAPDEIKVTAKSLSGRAKNMAIAIVGDIGIVPTDQEILKHG